MEPILVKDTNKKSYEIHLKNGFEDITGLLETIAPKASKIVIVTDENVKNSSHLKDLKKALGKKLPVFEMVFEPGEHTKCLENVEKLYDFYMSNKISRKDIIIALGGGVIGDLTGFSAATYLRGVNFVQCPTTLLSMADSSIGGKTAVDYKGIKNNVGAFYMPSLVYINLDVLKTLPDRQFFAGFAEVMKAALLADQKFYFKLIEDMYEICEKENEVLSEMLFNAINIKKAIVEKDPYETTGLRMLLNLGHTIGHGIESVMGDEYFHGECVSLGTVAAAYISYKKDLISKDDYLEIRDMFVPFYLPISIDTDKESEIFEAITYDKKNNGDSINMVLLKKIGSAFVEENVPHDLIKEAISELNFKEEG